MAYVFLQGLPNGFQVRGDRIEVRDRVDHAVANACEWIRFDLVGEEKFADLNASAIVAVIDDEEP
jgi:hypothetical protein